MVLVNRKVSIVSIIHCLAYIVMLINLFLMNMNIIIGKPVYFLTNIALSLISIILFLIVLFAKKGTDNTPIIGLLISIFSVIVVVGTLTFTG